MGQNIKLSICKDISNFKRNDGSPGHLLDLCCDCHDLDKMVDNIITGSPNDSDMYSRVLDQVEDRCRLPMKGGAIRISFDKVLPGLFIPSIFYLSSLHPILLSIFTGCIPVLGYLTARFILRYRPKSKIFVNTSYCVAFVIFYIYEVEFVGFFWNLPMIVSPLENLFLVNVSLWSLFWYWRVKAMAGKQRKLSDSKFTGDYCRICNDHMECRDHHCVWLDVCVFRYNYKQFLAFLVCTSIAALDVACILGSGACPGTNYGLVVLPGLCWPDNHKDRLFLTTGVYAGLIGISLVVLFVAQMIKLFRYKTFILDNRR